MSMKRERDLTTALKGCKRFIRGAFAATLEDCCLGGLEDYRRVGIKAAGRGARAHIRAYEKVLGLIDDALGVETAKRTAPTKCPPRRSDRRVHDGEGRGVGGL